MKAVLISIKPEWVAKILNGEKTIEIRKTMPKCELPCKIYIYCTKDKDNLLFGSPWIDRSWKCWGDKKSIKDIALVKGWDAKTGDVFDCCLANGKVIAEVTLNKITKHEKRMDAVGDRLYYDFSVEHLKNAGFVNREMNDWGNVFRDFDRFVNNYGNGKPLYAWHINNLKIYSKPKELSSFVVGKVALDCGYGNYNVYNKILIRPPQSWCYVEGVNDGN